MRGVDLNQFDLNLLVALDALLTEKSVTRAGTRLHLSQSAMSGALGRLRRAFDDDLLIPIGRRMDLTPLGQELVQPVRDILVQIRNTMTTRAKFDAATSDRHFSIAVSDYVITILLQDLLQRLASTAPRITFDLQPVGPRAIEDLERGHLDFLIAPRGFESPLHPTEVLFDESYTCVAWKGNTRIGSTLSLEQYLALGHVIVCVSKVDGPNFDEQVLRRLGYSRRVEVTTPSFDLAPQLVVGTNRIATVATRLACAYARLLPLKLLPVPFDMPQMTEMVQWHHAHELDPAHLWLRGELRQAVARLAAPGTKARTLASRPVIRRIATNN
jgi:LysR family transcriptional regulator, nod-box dependent transcriptional activator